MTLYLEIYIKIIYNLSIYNKKKESKMLKVNDSNIFGEGGNLFKLSA